MELTDALPIAKAELLMSFSFSLAKNITTFMALSTRTKIDNAE